MELVPGGREVCDDGARPALAPRHSLRNNGVHTGRDRAVIHRDGPTQRRQHPHQSHAAAVLAEGAPAPAFMLHNVMLSQGRHPLLRICWAWVCSSVWYGVWNVGVCCRGCVGWNGWYGLGGMDCVLLGECCCDWSFPQSAHRMHRVPRQSPHSVGARPEGRCEQWERQFTFTRPNHPHLRTPAALTSTRKQVMQVLQSRQHRPPSRTPSLPR